MPLFHFQLLDVLHLILPIDFSCFSVYNRVVPDEVPREKEEEFQNEKHHENHRPANDYPS